MDSALLIEQATPSAMRSTDGFPFDDEPGVRGGKSRLNDCLDDIAQRHPEVAEQLKDWRGSGKQPSKSNEEEKGAPEVSASKKSNLRNTVPDMQAAQEEDRGQRSQSAPPYDTHKHVSKVDIQPPSGNQQPESEDKGRNVPIKVVDEPIPMASSPPAAGPSLRPRDDNAHGPNKPQGPTVRHIPIFVEGRDEPLLPKEAQDVPHQEHWTGRSQHPPPHSWQQQTPSWQNQPSNHQWQTNAKPPPSSAPKPPQKAPPQQHTPRATQERELRVSRDEPDAPHSTPPPQKQVKHVETALEKVAAVQKEVDDLRKRVEQYQGNSKSDKDYIYLDEMLTRNLLKLDNIETEGKDDVRTARKNVIKDIQRYINILESKVAGSCNEAPSTDGMEVDSETSSVSGLTEASSEMSNPNSSQIEQMEVASDQASANTSDRSGKDKSNLSKPS